MRFSPCDCGVVNLVRMNRSFWMRWLPDRRHYFCVRCKAYQLLSRRNLRLAFPSISPDLDRDVTGPASLQESAFKTTGFAAASSFFRRTGARTPRH
jgi:hypothetical protein